MLLTAGRWEAVSNAITQASISEWIKALRAINANQKELRAVHIPIDVRIVVKTTKTMNSCL